MSICAAHCSWVCCSKSTSRMTSYSSSVSRIGSASCTRWGRRYRLVVRHKSDGTVAVLAWTHLLRFRYIPIIALWTGKSNILFKSRCNFRPHVELVDIRSRRLHASHDRIVRLSTFDRTSQGMMNLLGFIISLVYMQAVHGWLSTYERLVNSQNFLVPT